MQARPNLSGDVAEALRSMIVDARLGAGERINEVAIARELGVSRTPLREALAHLASEGFVESRPRHGYFVQRLRPPDVEELYRIRAILDPAALELAGLPQPDALARLRRLNLVLSGTSGVDAVIAIDDRWHRELLEHCPNRILLDLIEQFMQRTRPLERAWMRERGSVELAVAEHGRILDALEGGDLAEAAARLRRNMESAIAPLVAWVAERGG